MLHRKKTIFRKLCFFIFTVVALLSADTKIAELNVDTLKVSSEIKGLAQDREVLEFIAAKKALGNDYDILVGANLFYEIQGDSIEIAVSGYPAKYGKVRADKKFSPYISVKYQTSKAFPADHYYFSPYGANLEVGYMINRLFIGADFNYDWEALGGGMSFGRIKNINDWFSIIYGGSAGGWLLAADMFDNYGIAMGGFFVKTIFGTEKVKFEVSNRVLVPFGLAYQLGLGLTFTPFIGK